MRCFFSLFFTVGHCSGVFPGALASGLVRGGDLKPVFFIQIGNDYSLLRLSTQSNSDCIIGLRDFVSLVIEYSVKVSTPSIRVRVTSPWASSSFNRREIVVEDESTNFFKSENRMGLFFLSMTISICNDFDFVNSSSMSSTPL